MGIGVSVFLLAVGAILAFAVDVQTQGFDLNAVGVILMVLGVLGLALSFVFWDRIGFGGAGIGGYRRTYVRDTYDDREVYDDDIEPVVVARRRPAVRERRVMRDGF